VKRDEENAMQDLIQNYITDLSKLREVFHDELTATAEELSKALALYADRGEVAMASFMEKASACGLEFEAAAATRLAHFRGLLADGGPPHVDDKPAHNVDVTSIAATAEQAVADSLHVESDGDRKPQQGRSITLVKRSQVA
jgi:hypothetical protein